MFGSVGWMLRHPRDDERECGVDCPLSLFGRCLVLGPCTVSLPLVCRGRSVPSPGGWQLVALLEARRLDRCSVVPCFSSLVCTCARGCLHFCGGVQKKKPLAVREWLALLLEPRGSFHSCAASLCRRALSRAVCLCLRSSGVCLGSNRRKPDRVVLAPVSPCVACCR